MNLSRWAEIVSWRTLCFFYINVFTAICVCEPAGSEDLTVCVRVCVCACVCVCVCACVDRVKGPHCPAVLNKHDQQLLNNSCPFCMCVLVCLNASFSLHFCVRV